MDYIDAEGLALCVDFLKATATTPGTLYLYYLNIKHHVWYAMYALILYGCSCFVFQMSGFKLVIGFVIIWYINRSSITCFI